VPIGATLEVFARRMSNRNYTSARTDGGRAVPHESGVIMSEAKSGSKECATHGHHNALDLDVTCVVRTIDINEKGEEKPNEKVSRDCEGNTNSGNGTSGRSRRLAYYLQHKPRFQQFIAEDLRKELSAIDAEQPAGNRAPMVVKLEIDVEVE
jgi:hypothetical protein